VFYNNNNAYILLSGIGEKHKSDVDKYAFHIAPAEASSTWCYSDRGYSRKTAHTPSKGAKKISF